MFLNWSPRVGQERLHALVSNQPRLLILQVISVQVTKQLVDRVCENLKVFPQGHVALK